MPVFAQRAGIHFGCNLLLSDGLGSLRDASPLLAYLFGGLSFGGLNAVVSIKGDLFLLRLFAVALGILLLWHHRRIAVVSEGILNLYFICRWPL